MTTLWIHYWLVLRKRLLCRLLDRHADGVTISHGYATIFCQRCWRFEIERLPDVAP